MHSTTFVRRRVRKIRNGKCECFESRAHFMHISFILSLCPYLELFIEHNGTDARSHSPTLRASSNRRYMADDKTLNGRKNGLEPSKQKRMEKIEAK